MFVSIDVYLSISDLVLYYLQMDVMLSPQVKN